MQDCLAMRAEVMCVNSRGKHLLPVYSPSLSSSTVATVEVHVDTKMEY